MCTHLPFFFLEDMSVNWDRVFFFAPTISIMNHL